MTCDVVREAAKKVLEEIENARDTEKTRILRHLRSCVECRTNMSREDRDRIVKAIVMSFE